MIDIFVISTCIDGHPVYNENTRLQHVIQEKEVIFRKQMASTSKKQLVQSSEPHRKSRKTNKANLRHSQNDKLTIVGIGASAGGLKALQDFFEALPNHTGMAYVVITHLHPEHESHLAELLQTHTQMPVRQVTGLIKVESNCVYVIPPNRRLLMDDSKIDTAEFGEPRGQRAPIDLFFRSLAQTHPNAVGIILSGGGTDGAVGVKAIKEEGGLLMVQHPDEVELNATLEQRVEERTRELDEANQEIVHARDLFYTLFHANPIPTVLTRVEDDVFINVNDEFLNYFNFERDEIIGHSAQELGLEQGLWSAEQAREKFVARIKKEGRIGSYETEIRGPSGETRNAVASVQYINLDNTEALITSFIDITDRVRAEQQIRTLASELTAAEQTERHRLAQILHDDLQQRLFAIQMQMSFLNDAYEKNDLQAFAIDFPQLEEWLAEAIQVTRQLSVDLSPPVLHGEGLVEAVLWLASQMHDQYGLEVNIKSDGRPVQLDEKMRVLVFYAVRELLFNVVKHAGTLQATVDFEHHDHHLRVTVRDQGKGFDNTEVLSNPKIAHGLLIARHRLNLLGCKMEVNSQPGKGTEVVIEVPYEKMDS